MNTGLYNKYFWFQTFDSDLTIYRFLKDYKQHLFGRYVCVTSFDSGRLQLSDEEKQNSWTEINGVATSPAIKKETYLPTAGFDEWYVFAKRPLTITLKDVYVNYSNFNLDETSDLQKRFWQDIEQNQPDIYIAEGDNLIIVTTDEKLRQNIEKLW